MDQQVTEQVPQTKPSAKVQPIKHVKHFHFDIQLPEGATITPYHSLHTGAKKPKKLKNKYDEFSYYRATDNNEKISKVLFKQNDDYIVNGYYPFINPLSEPHKAEELGTGWQRVIKTEAAYIGHVGQTIVMKKMAQVKLGKDGTEFDTIGDNFETLPLENAKRFQQMMKILSLRPNALQTTIRVIVDESVPDKPRILDYQFFKREQQMKQSNTAYLEK